MIEKQLAPLIENLFPEHYRSQGPNFVAFVKAYFEFLDQNFQKLTLANADGFDVGNIITQNQTQGTIVSKTDNTVLVHVEGFDTFKCITMCQELIPVTSSSGASTEIVAGGVTKRLGVNYWARRLTELGDIDQTMDLFILRFKEKYLTNISFNTATNKRLLVKNSLDLYRSKGTPRSVDLFFRLIYGVEASVYFPGDDVFKTSDANWQRPQYIEVYTPNTSRIVAVVGKQIKGIISGATAFVERYIKRRTQNGLVSVIHVSNISGNFQTDELLSVDGTIFKDSPKISGSLTSVTVIDGATGFSIGSVVELNSTTGISALGRVTEINNERGVVRFELLKSGWGYTTDATSKVLVANTIVTLENVVSSNNVGTFLQQYEPIRQYVGNFQYTTSSLSANNTISFFNGTTLVNSGTVLRRTVDGSNGNITAILNSPYNISNGFSIRESANSQANAIITIAQDRTAVGYVVEPPRNVTLSVSQPSLNATFEVGSFVQQSNANGIVSSVVLDPSGGTITLANTQGVFTTGIINSNTQTANVTLVSTTVGLYDVVNEFYTDNRVVSSISNTQATMTSKSVGSSATFNIGEVSDVERVLIDTQMLDTISTLPLSSWQPLLYQQANMTNVNIGSVFSIDGINPGSGYTATPTVNVITPSVAALDVRDEVLTVANATGSFAIGENIIQSRSNPTAVFVVMNPITFTPGERVRIGNTVIQAAANATVRYQTGTNVLVNDIEGAWQPNHTIVKYANTQQNTAFTSAIISANTSSIKGKITDILNNDIRVERRTLYGDFTYSTIVGQITGVVATVTNVQDTNSIVGDNADVRASVFTSNGTIVQLEVLDSGFGFSNNQPGILTGLSQTGSFIGRISGLGTGSGFYTSTRGFLSDASKLQDGNYYQEYSYDIITRIPFNTYREMFQRVMHVAGKKFFGNLLLQSIAEIRTDVVEMQIDADRYSPFVVTSNNHIVTESDGDEINIRP